MAIKLSAGCLHRANHWSVINSFLPSPPAVFNSNWSFRVYTLYPLRNGSFNHRDQVNFSVYEGDAVRHAAGQIIINDIIRGKCTWAAIH